MNTESDDEHGHSGEYSDEETEGAKIPPRETQPSVDDLIQGRELYENERRLRALYEERGLTQQEIADALDTSQPTVSRYLKKYNITTQEEDGDEDTTRSQQFENHGGD